MPTLTYLGETYECATAIKGADYIHLLDENGVMIATFDEITSFSGFKLSNGSYTSPTADMNCYLAIVRDDGTIGKGGHKCSDIPTTPEAIGAAPDGFGWGKAATNISNTDLFVTLAAGKTGRFRGNGVVNSPDETKYFYFDVTAASSTYSHVTAYQYGGGVYEGSYDGGKFSGWAKAYDEKNKPKATDVGAVPVERTVNGKALREDIALTAADVNAVPPERTVNGRALSNNIDITADDVGALPKTGGTVTGDVTVSHSGLSMLAARSTSAGREIRSYMGSTDGIAGVTNRKDANNVQGLFIYPETDTLARAIRLYRNSGGSAKYYNVLHEGNIAANGVAKIETGSYVGTGTCGPNGPNEISFGFVPKMLWVWGDGHCPIGDHTHGYAIPCTNLTDEYKSIRMLASYSNTLMVKLVGNKVSFYSTAGDWDDEDEDLFIYDGYSEQLNSNGTTYYYMAIG